MTVYIFLATATLALVNVAMGIVIEKNAGIKVINI
jgi:hypothetical protein